MRNFMTRLRARRYDVAFDTQGLLKTGLLLGLARIANGGHRIGLANATEGSGYEALSRIFHTESVPVPVRCHGVERGRLVAAEALHYAIEGPPQFGLKDGPARQRPRPAWMPDAPFAAFFHGTAGAFKKWPQASWIALARALPLQVLLPWGSEEEKQAALEIAAASPNCSVLPRLPMMEAVALAQHASLVVGVDTGLTHIAAAFERPTVEIYCGSPRWKTEGNWSPNIINLGDLGQMPGVADVLHAVDQLRQLQDRAA
jgi:heptosyltransferase-1